MPFNGNGVFSILNTFLPGTTILSTPMNSNFTDIASGLTDCLTRDGQAGMTAQLKAIAGTVGAPGISFTNDLTTGLYLSNTGELSASAAGVRQWLMNSVSFQMTTGIVQSGSIAPASLSADQNNYAPTNIDIASIIRQASSNDVNITGLAGLAAGTAAVDGRMMTILNINTVGGKKITLVNQSASSLAANRFSLGANLIIYPKQAAMLRYNGTSGFWDLMASFQSVSNSPQGNCQFRLGSSTTVTLFPYQGNFVTFPSGAIATIPSAGITSTFNNASLNGTSGQTLSNTTLYYAYLWDSGGGTYVIDWSTTGHATDTTTGIEIKSGDATRVLVGMAYLIGANFLDSATNRLVASWFNRRQKTGTNTWTTNRSTTSTTIVEINTEIRINFLSWADSAFAAYSGRVSNTGATGDTFNYVILDSTSTVIANTEFSQPFSLAACNASCGANFTPSEGFHLISVAGNVAAGTSTWSTTFSGLSLGILN